MQVRYLNCHHELSPSTVGIILRTLLRADEVEPSCSIPKVITSRDAGFPDRHTMKPLKTALQPLPYPPRKILTGRVLQTLNLIQIIVIEPLAQRLECV